MVAPFTRLDNQNLESAFAAYSSNESFTASRTDSGTGMSANADDDDFVLCTISPILLCLAAKEEADSSPRLRSAIVIAVGVLAIVSFVVTLIL